MQRVLAFVVVVITICVATSSTDNLVLADNSYDYLAFDLQWAPQVCHGSSNAPCERLGSSFSIHGLWPSRNDGSYPSFCTSQQFNESGVSSLLTQLEANWPSLTGQNDDFWSHEYEKHGTCCEDILPTELDFFGQALKLYNQVGNSTLMQTFPVNQGQTLDQWEQQGKQAVGAKMYFQCSSDAIEAVQICYDKGLSIIDCTEDSQCSPSKQLFLYPPSSSK